MSEISSNKDNFHSLYDLVINDEYYFQIKQMDNGGGKILAEIAMYERIKSKYYNNLSDNDKRQLKLEISRRKKSFQNHNW
jgi:hypothetical protein